jgi:uncharacterized protein (TIGR02246 family)
MKSSIVALLLILAAISPSMAADLKEELLALEKGSWKAYANHDAKAYSDTMAEDAVVAGSSGDVMKGSKAILADLSNNPCDVKSFDLADTKLRQLSPDVALLTYNLTQDVTCGGGKLPAKAFVTAVYVRQGGKWRWASYQETALK